MCVGLERSQMFCKAKHEGERKCLDNIEVNITYIEPCSPWENSYVESFNGKMRDELLNCEIFDNMFEVRILIERWRKEYNTVRPYSLLSYKPFAPITRYINPDKCSEKSLSSR